MHDDGTAWSVLSHRRGEKGTGWDEKRDGLLCGVRWDQREEQEGTKDAGRTEGCQGATRVEEEKVAEAVAADVGEGEAGRDDSEV